MVTPSAEQTSQQPLLEASSMSKMFGQVSALTDAGLALHAGEVHALFGANGAGKSTLARIICGHIAPSTGSLRLNGEEVSFSTPRQAIKAGISIVTQETSIAQELPVWENIILPEYAEKRHLSRRKLRDKAAAAIAELGFERDLPVDSSSVSLSAAQRQLLEITRSVALQSKIIIFDEPTTSLSPNETGQLFEVMEHLRDRGHSMVFVSHRLEEIFAITDKITVLRDGLSVATSLPTSSLTQSELIRLMIGRDVDAIKMLEVPDTSSNPVVLSIEGVASGHAVRDVSLEVRAGEIVGLGGLIGAGRSELIETIMGMRPLDDGHVFIGRDAFVPSKPAAAIAAGFGYLPEDRRRQSIIPDFSVLENILLMHLGQQTGARLNYGSRRDKIHEIASLMDLPKERLSETSLLNFSGGMQQKSLLIRSLIMSPKVLLLDEPTKGIDIGSRSNIYKLLRQLASEGMAILLISSDFQELLALSHRVVPISDGHTIGSLPATHLDEEKLTLLAAPRSSMAQQRVILDEISKAFGIECAWMISTGKECICLARSGGTSLPMPGSIHSIDNLCVSHAYSSAPRSVVAESSGASSMLIPVHNKRDMELGTIAAFSAETPGRDLSELPQFVLNHMVTFTSGNLIDNTNAPSLSVEDTRI